MKRTIPRPTRAQQAHQDAQRAHGCAVCRFRFAQGAQMTVLGDVEIHHRNEGDMHGSRQIGQHATVALCRYHHTGVLLTGHTRDAMRRIYGPSFALHARDFRLWTQDVLPDFEGRGTERWQAWQDAQIRRNQEGRNAA